MVIKNDNNVVVVGGGPAGCATALRLIQRGSAVTIIERSTFSDSRVGESLLPAAEGLLRSLGVWERFEREQFQQSAGIVSVWGDSEPIATSFLCQPFSRGWNIDRARFDRMLLAACKDAGCRVIQSRGSIDFKQTGSKSHVRLHDGSRDVCADVLVDATGRRASIATRLGAKKIVEDRLMAIVGYFEVCAQTDSRLLIESVPNGWWYSAGLPDNRMVVVFLTDSDLIPHKPESRSAAWNQMLRRAMHTQSRIGLGELVEPLRTVNANTSRLDRACGAGWFAVGDAAVTLDPLSGNGIVRALTTGIDAADCIPAGGDAIPKSRYQKLIHDISNEGAVHRNDAYRRENRWNHLFWQRRCSAITSHSAGRHNALEETHSFAETGNRS